MYHHRIPCYGDLTPGIPDVIEAESRNRLATVLGDDVRSRQRATVERQASSVQPDCGFQRDVSGVFACLRLETGRGPMGAVLAVARDFSPRVMVASDVEVLLDISGLGRLIGPPDEIARQLAHALSAARVTANVAIGQTQTIARVLAHANAARAFLGGVPRDHDAWTELPVHVLQPLEAGLKACATPARNAQRLYETLDRWGIVTLGDLAALPPADVSSRLGRRGVALHQLARGLDLRPFVPDRETRRFIERLELEWPVDNLEPLSFVLARVLDPLSEALERADRGAVAIHLELRLIDRSTFTRVLPLPVPMRDARVLRTLLLLALESAPPPAAIDIVSIELDPAPARIVRFSLLDRALPSPETVATLTARLSALVGESRVGSAVLLDSHAPDAIAMTRFAPGDAAGADRRKAAGGADADPVDRGAAVLRRQRMPVALRVSCERGRPVHIAASRRGIPSGAITEAAGPWRTSGNWWTQSYWTRNEWDVALKSGAVCRIYQDRTTERWFLEGVYD